MGKIGELQKRYNANKTFRSFFQKVMGLALIPSSRIAEATAYLQLEVNRMVRQRGAADLQPKVQQLLDYVMTNWIDGRMFKHSDWCGYMVNVRTNNHMEGYHSRLNSRMGSKKKNPKYIDLMKTLHEESKQVALTIAELANGQYSERVNKKAAERNLQLTDLWTQFQRGRIETGVELLKAVSEDIGKLKRQLVNFLADPDDLQGTVIEDDDMEADNSG